VASSAALMRYSFKSLNLGLVALGYVFTQADRPRYRNQVTIVKRLGATISGISGMHMPTVTTPGSSPPFCRIGPGRRAIWRARPRCAPQRTAVLGVSYLLRQGTSATDTVDMDLISILSSSLVPCGVVIPLIQTQMLGRLPDRIGAVPPPPGGVAFAVSLPSAGRLSIVRCWTEEGIANSAVHRVVSRNGSPN